MAKVGRGRTAEAEPESEVLGGDASRLVQEGHTLMRIQNETMQTVSVQRPRDERKIIDGALAELDLVPEEAKAAFYSIPYKDRGRDGQVRVVNVTGLSISAAMALFRRWGNADAGALPLQEDAAGWTLSGWFIDLETNARIFRPVRASKYYKPRGGGPPIMLSVDRQVQAFQKGVSIAIRNAILAGLPAYLKNAYDKKARAIAGGQSDAPADPKAVEAAIRAFTKWKITKEQLEAYTELPAAQWTGTEVADLRGVWNAINDDQVELAEVFGTGKEAEGTPEGASKLDGLTETIKGAATAPPAEPPKAAEAPPPPPAKSKAPADTVAPPAPSTPAPAPVATPPAPVRVQAPAGQDAPPDRNALIGQIKGLRDKLALKDMEMDYLMTRHLGNKAALESVGLPALMKLYDALWKLEEKKRGKK